MKLKQYIKAACLFSFVAVTTSCMDLEPLSDLGDNLVWDNAANFQLFANQFYSWPHDFDRAVSDEPHSDYRSDLVAGSSMNVYSQGTNAIPATDANYTKLYKRIYYTNLLLKNAESFDVPADIIVPVAEAKFFRAYSHFELVQLYGDAIILTEPLDLDSEKLYGRRNDRGEVIDQVIKDLKDAVGGLPETSSEAGRLNKYIAYAMLSRVALYEGTWQKFHTNGKDATSNTSRSTELLTIAKDAANEVIKGGKYQLFYNEKLGNESYRYMFTLEDGAQCNPANLSKSDNTEYIFVKRHRNGDKTAWNLTHGMVANACYVTRKLANMYLCSDGLPIGKSSKFQQYAGVTDEFQNRDNRMGNNMLYHGQQYWNNDGKWRTTWTDADLTSSLTANVRSGSGYQNRKWGTERQVEDYYESYDFPVIRYAEVLLNYAEAVYELNGTITDSELDYSLNKVRLRVNPNMPKLSSTLVSANNLSMREEIRRERTVELVLEGFRIDDLKRWATAPDEMPQDMLGIQVTGTWFETNWTDHKRSLSSDGCLILYSDRTWNDKLYLYPLPSDQLQLNPQLEQNPGWKN
ncbi:Cell surface glycan-binding lipoprotein, utilization system for glycans and polysaccharides (PUL), SusD family [Bacteroides ovatus]|jgi:putative outer membrane protein, probably involved in nutrient binding|uniref:RagB/SusD family nutrient uptake outer membrane protein n=1 Tax=Bacteroides TaxID=816 RepID=UPI000E82CF9A|nr:MULTISPECIES: RagB/SusD family nutrient uptake outer membrane protein [Bacteroides]MCS3177527.1 RagB/SusD family nutrient uptake outer membrane protein [Candidatus Bacteroides intestinigallinarum]RGN55135.1 RagB/SusD family nutrient uptake outer membrane protein [Bacteroides sp. OM05-10AA]RGQ59566.1 RagB/SusD family nutrient uptake outer membrane protein [Bacteroides sp. AF27-33]CAG9889169.1 Cell surface glycan-binding lipoprotein, utilization system for glycans and polysaccharides (PUL), Su